MKGTKKVQLRKLPPYDYIIEAKEVKKEFGFKAVLKGVDLQLKEGDFLALFGPNGAGKTTFIQILCSLMRPSSGKVCIVGFDPRSDREALCEVIGFVSHHTFLYHNLSAFENLKFYGMMYNVPALDAKIEKLLELVGLADFANDQVQTFSRGMQQRLSLARAIIHDPMVLFLDEPYTGLDQLGAEDLKQILVEFRDKGKTIVMTSHNLDRGLELCSRVAILRSGRVVYNEEISKTKINDFKPIYFKYTGKKPLPSQVAV